MRAFCLSLLIVWVKRPICAVIDSVKRQAEEGRAGWGQRRLIPRVRSFCAQRTSLCLLTNVVSQNACSYGFVLQSGTLKDWVMATSWTDATRYGTIEEGDGFASVYDVTLEFIIDFSSYFGMCSETRRVKQLFDFMLCYRDCKWTDRERVRH